MRHPARPHHHSLHHQMGVSVERRRGRSHGSALHLEASFRLSGHGKKRENEGGRVSRQGRRGKVNGVAGRPRPVDGGGGH